MLYTAFAETIILRIVPLTGASNAITQDSPAANGPSNITHIPLIEISTVRPSDGGLPPSSITFARQRKTLRGAILGSESAIFDFKNYFNEGKLFGRIYLKSIRIDIHNNQ
jgi:hypothetical protein